MADRPRLEPSTDSDWDDETRAMLDGLGHLNIFTTLAHHPKLLKRWLVFGGHVLMKNTVPLRERELLILRTGWRCSCEYEFGQHTAIGRTAGLNDAEIHRLTVEGTQEWSASDAVLVQAADELVLEHGLSDATFEALAADWSHQQIIDIIFTVGQYVLVSMALNSLGVQLEDDAQGWPS